MKKPSNTQITIYLAFICVIGFVASMVIWLVIG